MCTSSDFNVFLRENNLLYKIYEAMESDDYSDVVMAARKTVDKSPTMLHPRREKKCERLSDNYRKDGNLAFKVGDARLALDYYNKALRYAPNNSRAMLLAYSNRSAVLYMTETYAACLLDIETCFRLGCPSDIIDKIYKRKELATAKILHRNVLDEIRASYDQFFRIDNCNPEVPCASADVEIIVNDGTAKIIAAKDIKVGSTVAVESSFVGVNSFKIVKKGVACRYCFSTSLNLIPCDGCCFAMFCSEKCKRKCQQEYHRVECHIMEVIADMDFCPKVMLMATATLKFVQMCGSWKEAIAESYCTGSKRRRVSTASQMFDVGNKLSILNYEEDNVFVHGNMYENSFICAKIINSLDKIPFYFPRSPSERELAMRAVARIMMYLALYAKPTTIVLIKQPSLGSDCQIPISKSTNHGIYPFIGKLQNSCIPNTIVAHICNKSVLIALQPIKKGSEITVSRMGHFLDINLPPHFKNFESFMMFGTVCKCCVCSNDWKTRNDILTEKQLAAFKKYMAKDRTFNPQAPLRNFHVICELLECLSNAPFSKEYNVVYADFRENVLVGNFFMTY